LWGDKEDQSIAYRITANGYAEQTSNHILLVHCDHTRSNPHVQLFVTRVRKNISGDRTKVAINNRYFLTRKVLRQNRYPDRQVLPIGAFPPMNPANPSPAELLAICELAARAGAEQLIAWRGRFTTREKAPRDLVTDADYASEKAVRAVIAEHFPEHGILGEEAPSMEQLDRPYCWVVDPLDGTINYAHGLPCYGVSVAVASGGKLLAGVVYDPERKESFAAALGGGARLNGQVMQVSPALTVEESLVAVSFPPRLNDNSLDLRAFAQVGPVCQAMRRTGSAALNLAYVACGRLDAHWAHEIHPWDAAAGVLLVSEAGGAVTAADGRPFDLVRADYLAASTTSLHQQLLPLIS
jgi:myo-inositol-1(or 4)-monophosphatase